MSSVRQQLVDALETRLGQIVSGKVWTLPTGATHTCTTTILNVCPWRKTPFSTAQVPAIAFWDTMALPGNSPFGSFDHRLQVTIAGFISGKAAADKPAVNAARELQADILAAIGSDQRWGGLAQWTELENVPLDMEQEGDVVAACELQLTIYYRTGLWQI
jgi:hypothetical protein